MTVPLRYRVWLRLLPAHLREEHGRELQADLLEEAPPLRRFAPDVIRASIAAHSDILRQDLAVAVRQLRRAPTFALVAGVTLAAGIGGNVAFFALADAVLVRQLPMIGADRIVDIGEENVGLGMRNFGISPGNFRDVARDTSLFVARAVHNSRSGTVRIGETRERVSFSAVGGEFFRVFTEAPVLGRALSPDDDVAGASAIVVSFDFWQRLLGGDPNVVGRQVEVDGAMRKVVGVMPQRFAFPNPATAFWEPIGLSELEWQTRGSRFVEGVARLRPGVSVAAAAAAADQTGRMLATMFPKTSAGWTVLLRDLRSARVGSVRMSLLLVWAAAGLVLMIAIANVASLFVTRAVARERELAIRVALGARAGRVVRQLVTESVVLIGISSAAGLGLASVLLERIRPLASNFVPRMSEVAVGGRAALYTAVLALLTTTLLTVFALSSTRRERLWRSLGTGRAGVSPSRRRMQRATVIAEVALAVFVMVGGGLVVRTLRGVLSQPMGFVADSVLTFRVEPPWRAKLDGTPQMQHDALMADRNRASVEFDLLIDRLEAIPGVRRVGAVNRLPLTGDWWTTSVGVPERAGAREGNRSPAYVRPITPGYFDAMGTHVLRGRAPSPSDGPNAARVLVVDAELARWAWGDADPIGREVLLDGPPNQPPPRARVVGVVETIHMNRLDAGVRPTMYVPFSQAFEGHYLNWGMDVVVRHGGRIADAQIRQIVRDVFPDAVVFRIASMDDIIGRSTANRRFQLFVLGFFGVVALLLSTIGVGGAILISVRERREELAVRLALGAAPERLWWSVQREGLSLAAWGAFLGLMGAVAGAGVFSSLVYGIEVRDPTALLSAVALAMAAAFVATAIPAVNAMRVDPALAMRE